MDAISGLEYSLIYPGQYSCLSEIVNRFDATPLVEIRRSVDIGIFNSIQTGAGFAKSFGIYDSGEVAVQMVYQLLGGITFACTILVDDMSSGFRIGFLPDVEPGEVLGEDVEEAEWVAMEVGIPEDGRVNSDYGGFRLIASISEGPKAYFTLDIHKSVEAA